MEVDATGLVWRSTFEFRATSTSVELGTNLFVCQAALLQPSQDLCLSRTGYVNGIDN